MLRTVEDVKGIEGADGFYAQFGLAMHRVWKARANPGDGKWLDEAESLLDKLALKRPDWPAVLLARAEVEEMRGNVDKALNHYRQALNQGERSPRAVRQYGQLLLKCRRYDEMDALVRQSEKAGGLSADLRRMAAFASVKNNDFARAEALAEWPAGPDSEDFRDVLWRGQILATAGKNAEAEKALCRATEMAGDEPDPWVALVRFYGATRRKDRAEEVIQSALAKLPAEKRTLTVAHCYEMLGNNAQAAKNYAQALADQPADLAICRGAAGFYLRVQDITRAEPCLRRIIDRKLPSSPGDVVWAQRQLAVALALQGNYRRYGEA